MTSRDSKRPSETAHGELLEALCASRGLIAAVGAGGKKSTLQRLVSAHPGSVALTNTVHSRPVPDDLKLTRIVADSRQLAERIEQATAPRRVAYARPGDKPDRHAGIDPNLVAEFHRHFQFDATFVKADGARMRYLKAPRQGEPLLPPGCNTVLALTSARVLGRPLDDTIAHRLQHITQVTGAAPGEPLRAEHLARLYLSEDGLLRGVGTAKVVPIMNMVDDDETRSRARQVAEQVLADSAGPFDRFVLARMNHLHQPIVEVLWLKN